MGILYGKDVQAGLHGYPERVVWKYPFVLDTTKVQEIWVRGNRPHIVHCAFDTEEDGVPCLWIEHDRTHEIKTLYLRIFATGEVLPTYCSHLATLESNGFYWHVYTIKDE